MKLPLLALIAGPLLAAACVPDRTPDTGPERVIGESAPVIDGRYDLDPARCGDANSQTRMQVRGDGFEFYESSCTFGRRAGQQGAAEGVLICLGEGQRFTRDIRLESTAEGLVLHENGVARAYSRCASG